MLNYQRITISTRHKVKCSAEFMIFMIFMLDDCELLHPALACNLQPRFVGRPVGFGPKTSENYKIIRKNMLRDKWLGMSSESTNGTNVNCFENPKAWQEVPGSSCCGCCFRHQKKGRWRIFPPNSVLLGVLNAILSFPPWCWMVCLPSGGSCLPLSSIPW